MYVSLQRKIFLNEKDVISFGGCGVSTPVVPTHRGVLFLEINKIVHDAIEAAYATTLTKAQMKRLVVSMAGEEIDMETDFVSNGIEDGARLEVCIFILCFFFLCM